MYIDDTPALSINEFRSKIRRLISTHHIKIAIVDYLQLMTAGGTPQSREQEVSTISRSLKAIAKEAGIPIIALSQLSRNVVQRGGNMRPQLSDLRESGAIEQDADMVIFIHRPEYYGLKVDEDGNSLIGLAEIIVAKHRNGAVDDVRLQFKSEFTQFCDPETLGAIQTFRSKMNGDAPETPSTAGAGIAPDTSFDAPSFTPPTSGSDMSPVSVVPF